MEFIRVKYCNFKNQGNLEEVWNACESPIFWVCNSKGVSVSNARTRHLHGIYWLYVDDLDGYAILDEYEIGGLNLLDRLDRYEDE